MIMLRTTSILLALAAVVGMSACGSSDGAAKSATPGTAAPVHTAAPVQTAAPVETAAPLETAAPVDTAAPVETAAPVDTAPGVSVSKDAIGIGGITWVPTRFITVGPLDPVPAGVNASIMFPGDGTVRVDTGCNSGSAAVTFTGDSQFAIGAIALTKKACAADLMAFETRFVGLLEEPSYWSISGPELTVYPANITDTGIIFDAASSTTPNGSTPATFQTTS